MTFVRRVGAGLEIDASSCSWRANSRALSSMRNQLLAPISRPSVSSHILTVPSQQVSERLNRGTPARYLAVFYLEDNPSPAKK